MTDIVCRAGVDLLTEYLEGALPQEVQAALDEHVAGCARCAAFVESYRSTPRILRDATAAALPEDVEASLRAFLRARAAGFRST